MLKTLITFLLGLSFSTIALAANSPVGTWKTIDDKTHKTRSIVKITESKGELKGTILKVFKQPGDTGYCRKCPGRFKDKPVKGLQIMWGLKKTGKNTWGNGRILDPKNGKIYSCKVVLADNNRSLQMRGYLGFALLGRTQIWKRN